MSDFQWNDSHVEWFVRTFKDKPGDVNAGIVHSYYHRKKGELQPHNQDYRNLMRLVVKKEFARVTQGFFTSRRYAIRMVTGNYPYIQTVFDQELFLFMKPCDTVPNGDIWEKLFPDVSKDEWNGTLYRESGLFMVAKAEALRSAFLSQNYLGGELSANLLVYLDNDKVSGQNADYFQLEIENFILQYKALKAASPELASLLQKDNPPANGLHYFEGFDSSFFFENVYNYYFYKIIQANLVWDFWRHVGRPGKNNKRSRSTELKRWGEVLSGRKDGCPIDKSDYPIDNSDYSQEFLDVRMFYQLVSNLPKIANRPEVIAVVDSWLTACNELRHLEYALSK
jgi:hypothetical protein